MKEEFVLTFLILGFIFDHVFDHAFALYSLSTERGMSNVIYLELYLKSEGLNILMNISWNNSILALKNVICNTVLEYITSCEPDYFLKVQ